MSVTIGDPRKSGEEGPAGDQREAGEAGPAGDPRPAGDLTLEPSKDEPKAKAAPKPAKKAASKS